MSVLSPHPRQHRMTKLTAAILATERIRPEASTMVAVTVKDVACRGRRMLLGFHASVGSGSLHGPGRGVRAVDAPAASADEAAPLHLLHHVVRPRRQLQRRGLPVPPVRRG